MTLINQDEQALKIHTDPKTGFVWYCDRTNPIICSNLKPSEFENTTVFKSTKHIRLIGSKENAKLIVQLHWLKKETGKLKKVEVCSPLVCLNTSERKDPEAAIFEMRRWNYPASLGGFHETNENDYYQYLLTHEVNKPDYEFNDHIKRLLKLHPAWPYLSFIGHLDILLAAKLLALIIDPRWYIDFDEPDSGAKLRGYLGLTPKTQAFVSGEPNSSHGIHADRCRLVLDTWKTSESVEGKDLHFPTYFLWRIYKTNEKTEYKADLRTSQSLISFLRHTWISELCSDSHKGKDALFIPAYFFKLEEEVKYFEQHIFNYKKE